MGHTGARRAPAATGASSRATSANAATAPRFEDRTDLTRGSASDTSFGNGVADPGDDLGEHLVEGGGGLESEEAPGLVDGRYAALHVVLEGLVGEPAEGHIFTTDRPPDALGQFEHGCRSLRRDVEILVRRRGMLHGSGDSAGDVTTVRVVTHLGAVAEDVQRVLALEDLLYKVRHHMAHGQLHVAAEDLDVAERASFADPDTVERSHDRVGQAVLLVGGAREVLDGELLKPVGRTGRGDLALLALTRRPRRRRLENHRRADVGDLLETGVAEGADGGVAGRRDHALVGR